MSRRLRARFAGDSSWPSEDCYAEPLPVPLGPSAHPGHPALVAGRLLHRVDCHTQAGWSPLTPSTWPTTQFRDSLYDVEIRKVICSTNAIESLNTRYRRAVKARGHFPTEQAAMKCLYLVTRSLDPTGQGRTRWTMRWKPALNAFAITFADRWPTAETYVAGSTRSTGRFLRHRTGESS